jgi:hypothetical protein
MSAKIDEIIAGLNEMRGLMRKRQKREKVAAMLSDQFLLWRALSAELAGSVAEFNEPRAKGHDEDEPVMVVQVVEQQTPLTALMESEAGVDGEADEESYEMVTRLREMEDVEEAAVYLQQHLHDVVRTARLVTVRAMIRHIWQGAVNPWMMMKHALAITRAYAQKQLRGITQTELALLLNETRQATSTRERQIHDELLARWGVRGYKPDGGLKSESARRASKKSATGNRNRATAERRRRQTRILTGCRKVDQSNKSKNQD